MKKLFLALVLILPYFASADVELLTHVRVVYRPDGVSVIYAIADACVNVSETACLEREQIKSGLAGLPFEDMLPSELPQDRTDRDKWRGSKGKGIHVDESLVTKQETLAEIQAAYDAEDNNPKPDETKLRRLQDLKEVIAKLKFETNVIPKEALNKISETIESINSGDSSISYGSIFASPEKDKPTTFNFILGFIGLISTIALGAKGVGLVHKYRSK